MSGTPNYASTPAVAMQTMTAADATTTAPVAAKTIFTPGASGGQVERVVMVPLGTVTATAVRVGYFDGAAYHLLFELQLAAYTSALSVARPNYTAEAVNYPNMFPIIVPTGWTLVAWMNDAQAAGVAIGAQGGSY